jgi:hypothetical protein
MRLVSNSVDPKLFMDLLGKPFVKQGRGPDAFDCVGLALEMARRLGYKLPDYVSSEEVLHQQLGAAGATFADMPQIPRPVPGCIVLLRMRPDMHHIAFMVDEYRMIHVSGSTGCVIERVLSPLWQRKIVGFYSLEAA